ncbi:ABC transporter permease [Georgenia faecalis]|uniref:ABC transporter permease n=1 Tax=Georgenia faecalis TaxID=2483799 RepID=UPI000FDA4FCC|nr:ABC transporter permease [Georgenia faecalis]
MSTTLTPAPRPGFARLTLLHGRSQFLETVRIPVAVIGNMVFPALALVFFVVPNAEVAQDPLGATTAVAQLALFSVMSTCLFTFGSGVAEDRALPFDPYVRTLPAGPGPRIAGRLLNGSAFALLGLAPVVVVGALLTAARPGLADLAAGVGVLVLTAVPFALLGMTIGYACSAKAAIAVVQVTLFPLAFAGGLFMPPFLFPGWLDSLSMALPSRAARDLVVQATTGEAGYAGALPVLLGWTALLALACVATYRRDEGRRFR